MWDSRATARADVFRIEVEYNRTRLRRHPESGYLTLTCLPQRLPPACRGRLGGSEAQWQADSQLYRARGRRIAVTVTGYGDEAGTVTVARELPAGRVRLRLAEEQADGLGASGGGSGERPSQTTAPAPAPPRARHHLAAPLTPVPLPAHPAERVTRRLHAATGLPLLTAGEA